MSCWSAGHSAFTYQFRPTTGTLGLLLLAKERGLIVAVAPVLEDLERHGFRITRNVRLHVLQLASE